MAQDPTTTKRGRSLAAIFLPLAAGYTLSYLFRNINAVLAPALIAEFGLDSATLGALTGTYLLAFGAMQVPLGLLIDRYGARRVQTANLLLAAAGALVFAAADRPSLLMVGRALIGAGVAVSLMGGLAVFTRALPARHVPAAFGCLLTFGGVGAVLAGTPTDMVVQAIGWRRAFVILACLSLAVAAAVWWLIPEQPGRPEDRVNLLAGLRTIFASRLFWRIVPLAMLTCGTGFALHGLWTGLWLADVAGLGREEVGLHLSAMAFGLLVGSAACGPAAALAQRAGLPLMLVVIVLSVVFLAALACLAAGAVALAMPLWIAIGFLINPVSLSYAVLSQSFPAAMAGRVNAAINVLVLSASFAIQVGLGIWLDLWGGSAGGHVQAAYATGLGGLTLAGALSLIWALPAVLQSPQPADD